MQLRKGHFRLEINHYFGSDSIGAKEAKIELREGIAVFECTLFPVDRNQESDAEDRKEKEFSDVEFFSLLDAHIRKNVSHFLKHHKDEIESWRFDLHYKGTRSFPCTIQPLETNGIMFHV